MRTFVVPDSHGRWDLVAALLAEAGVPPSAGARAGVAAVHLGDLANCVRDSVVDDVASLEAARGWFDAVLVGNHEWPYINRHDHPFSGFSFDDEVYRGVKQLLDDGILKPCLLVGGTLLTHAGVAAGWEFTTAAEAEKNIRFQWLHSLSDPILTGCSRARGGGDPFGGILWRDDSEPAAPFSQVHGHTPHRDGPHHVERPDRSFVLNLDVGASKGWAARGETAATRIVGVWLDESGSLDGYVEYAE